MTLVAAYRSIDGGLLSCADREENENYARLCGQNLRNIETSIQDVYRRGRGPTPPIALANAEIERKLYEVKRKKMRWLNIVQSSNLS